VFWGVSGCFEGVLGYYGMSQGCSGVVQDCSVVFWGVPGVFLGVLGFTDTPILVEFSLKLTILLQKTVFLGGASLQ